MRKCNAAVQTITEIVCPLCENQCAPALALALFLSLAPYFELPLPHRNGVAKSNNTKHSRTRAAWLLALLSSSIEHTPQWANNYNRYKGANGTKPLEQWAAKRKREDAMCE